MTPHNQGGAHVPVVPAHRKLPWRPKFVDVVRTWRPSAATLAARCIQPATRVCGTHPDGRSTASATFPSTRLSTRTHKSLRINNLHIPRPLDTTSDTVRQSCLWSDYHPFPISTHAVPRKVLSRRTAERIDDQQGFHGHHPDQAHPSSPGRSFNNGDRTAPTTALFGHSADTVNIRPAGSGSGDKCIARQHHQVSPQWFRQSEPRPECPGLGAIYGSCPVSRGACGSGLRRHDCFCR